MVLTGAGSGVVAVASGAVLVMVGDVLLMEAASGVMLVMGGWGRVEVGSGAGSVAAAVAISFRPWYRELGISILPAARRCSAQHTRGM